jgi:hypothetical protein
MAGVGYLPMENVSSSAVTIPVDVTAVVWFPGAVFQIALHRYIYPYFCLMVQADFPLGIKWPEREGMSI